jgi:hypothetical protein
MGVRERAYWLHQAEAVRRRMIASMAYAVSIGMGSGEEAQKAFDKLELTETWEESRQKQSEANWNMLLFMKEGKCV